MSFTEAVKTCFQKYAVFSGRARPSEYWWWVLFNILLVVVLVLVFSGGGTETGAEALIGLAWLALLLPSLAVTVRRLHDTGRSGWWWFISLVPLVGPIVLIVFLATAGDPGPNRYGPAPTAIGSAQHLDSQP
jgi:uncharacterized membrane protein YhaH (DUF805 family)